MKMMKQIVLAVCLVYIRAISGIVEAQQGVKGLLHGHWLHRPKG